jgi:hypothetical protein
LDSTTGRIEVRRDAKIVRMEADAGASRSEVGVRAGVCAGVQVALARQPIDALVIVHGAASGVIGGAGGQWQHAEVMVKNDMVHLAEATLRPHLGWPPQRLPERQPEETGHARNDHRVC